MKNYKDYYDADVPGRGNVAYDDRTLDITIHGFQYHKVVKQQILDTIEYNTGRIKALQQENRRLKKQI